MRILLFTICLFVLGTFISCNNDEPETPDGPSFEIESNQLFTVQEKYDNGWIKSAIKLTSSGETEYEVEYHENGYLSSYKVYELSTGKIEFEHWRDDRNLPVASHYYDIDGNLYAALQYSGGQLTNNWIYNDGYTTGTNFQKGRISFQQRFRDDRTVVATMTYDYENGKKSIFARTNNGEYNLESNIDDFVATGYDYNDDFQFLNIVDGQYTLLFNSLSATATSSIEEREGIDPIVSVGVTSLYYSENEPEFVSKFGNTTDLLKLKSSLNDVLFRSIREQYPFFEDVVFVGNSNFLDKEYFGQTNFVFADFIEEQKANYGEDFNTLFGTDYVNSYITGLYIYYVGTLRNLPTDESLRTEIIAIAGKHINWITTGNDPITEEEQDLLNQVFFEFKIHSNSGIDENGLVIQSNEQFQTASDQLSNAEMKIIQSQLFKF